jgi:hypothetical protein
MSGGAPSPSEPCPSGDDLFSRVYRSPNCLWRYSLRLRDQGLRASVVLVAWVLASHSWSKTCEVSSLPAGHVV